MKPAPILKISATTDLTWLVVQLYALGYRRDNDYWKAGLANLRRVQKNGYITVVRDHTNWIRCPTSIDGRQILVNSQAQFISYLKARDA